ncbi:MAG: hypothetical protein ABH860_03035, partial [bacterium]
NLVHMEMTSIGGRAPSNMVTYMMEASRGQQAFIMNGMYMKLGDLNTANNQRFQSDQKLRLYAQIKASAGNAYLWSWVPVVGGIIGGYSANMANLKNQKEQLEETKQAKLDGATLKDPELNALLANGLMDTGNGTVGVDYQKMIDSRSAIAKDFIKGSVESSIKKILRQMRSLVHMEMTNIQSSAGPDFADQANMVSFQTAMQSVSMITSYLAQKAQIQNRVTEADKNVGKLTQQINNMRNGGLVALGAAVVVAIFVPGGFASFSAAFSTVQLASSVANVFLGIVSSANAWIASTFANNAAKNDMGEAGAYLNMKKTMDGSVNSTTSRLEQLEQECIDEINAGMIQDLGAGYMGVNKSLAVKYKGLIERLYKAEKKKAEVRQVLQEMRNAVHETLSGISGVTSNSALSVLNINEQEIKAKIDDMFSKLEVAANRWNEITDAQRDAQKAEIQKKATIVSTAINAAIVAVQCKVSFSKEARLEAKELKALGNDKAKIQEAIADANSKSPTTTSAGKAIRDNNNLQKTWMPVATYALPALDIFIKWQLAFVEKAVMDDVQAGREGQVAGKGITKTAKTSSVVSQNLVIEDSFSDFAAGQDAVSGQYDLDNQAATYALKKRETENDFKDNIYQVTKEAVEYGKKALEALLKYLIRNWKPKSTEAITAKSSEKIEKEAVPVEQKPAEEPKVEPEIKAKEPEVKKPPVEDKPVETPPAPKPVEEPKKEDKKVDLPPPPPLYFNFMQGDSQKIDLPLPKKDTNADLEAVQIPPKAPKETKADSVDKKAEVKPKTSTTKTPTFDWNAAMPLNSTIGKQPDIKMPWDDMVPVNDDTGQTTAIKTPSPKNAGKGTQVDVNTGVVKGYSSAKLTQ